MINFFKYHTNPEELYGHNVPYVIVDEYGDKRWYLNGEIYRVDGPAIELTDGTKYWSLHNRLHRVDGPAVEYSDGDKYWYLNGEPYSFEEWKEERKKYL
jgi:hypothetical protein